MLGGLPPKGAEREISGVDEELKAERMRSKKGAIEELKKGADEE
jgi:hypothetical protein